MPNLVHKFVTLLFLINFINCNQVTNSIKKYHFKNETLNLRKTRSFNWLTSQDTESDQNELDQFDSQDEFNDQKQFNIQDEFNNQQEQFDHQDSIDQSKSDQQLMQSDQPQFDEPKQTRNVLKIPIGAIFTPKDKALRSAFIYAVKAHNRFESSRFQIEPIIDVIDTNDAFRFTRQLCIQLSRGIYALVTPVGVSHQTLISYSNTFHLPFVYAGSPLYKKIQNPTNVKYKQSTNKQQNFNHQHPQTNTDLIADYGLYLQPDIVHAIHKIMLYLKWDHFVYLYDSEEGLIKLQNLLELIHERLPNSNSKIDLKIVHRIYNEQDAYQFLRSYQNFRLKQASSSSNLTPPLPESAINYTNDTKQTTEESYDDLEDILNIRTDQTPPIYVVLDCKAELVAATIRKHIDDIYMNRKNFHYLIINLNIDDLAVYNLTNFGGLNITGFRILNKRQFISYWKSLDPILWPGAGSKNIETGASLVFDAARLLFESFERLLKDQKTENFNQNHNLSITNQGINCAQLPLKPWSHGKKIFQQLRKTTMQGLTGHLAFGVDSRRTNYTIEIIQTTMNSELTKIAEYHYTRPSFSYNQYDKYRFKPNKSSFDTSIDKYDLSNDKLDIDKFDDKFIDEEDQYGKLTIVPANFQRITNKDSTLENKTYIITSILEEPFLMLKKKEPGKPEPTGNDRFIGYCKDLTDLIAEQLNINYELRLVADGKYGARTPSGGYNGLVGELIRKEADMAIAPLTITSAREKVIQFSKPFLSLGISIMIKKPEKSKEGSFSFMRPLHHDIWIFILLSYSLVSVILYLVSKCSPSEVRKVLSANPNRRGHYHKKNSISQENYLEDLVNEYGQHYLHYPQSNMQSNNNLQSNMQQNIPTLLPTNIPGIPNAPTSNLQNSTIYSNNQFDYQLNNRHSFENNHSTSNLPTSTSNETYFENEIISPSTTFNLNLENLENLEDVDNEIVENKDMEEVLYLNEFNLVNSAWFALGAVLQQGVDVCPRSYSGRIVGSCWWFFTLIIISSYTANLAAFLTVERMVTPINSADDLAKQTEVEYGVLKDSSTQEFFRNSQVQVYKRMYEFMSSRPHVFVDKYSDGIKRVRESKGKYAFLMESTQNEYINERMPCDTMKVGRNLDAKGFGIATSLYSSLHVKLNLAVLSLTEKGDLTRLENKWWYDSSECKGTSNTIDVKEMQTSLTLDNVEGIFYILFGGLCCSLITAMIDLTCRCYKESVRDKVPFCSALWRNLKISFHGKMVIVQKNQIYYSS